MTARYRPLIPALALLLLLTGGAPAADTDALGDPLPDGALARLGTLRFRDGTTITSAALSPDGKTVAVGGSLGVRFFDLATGKPTGALQAGAAAPAPPRTLAYSPDGKVLVSTDFVRGVQLWNAASGEPLAQIPLPAAAVARQHASSFSGDGRLLALTADNPGRDGTGHAAVYEVMTGKKVCDVELLHDMSVRAFLSPDGKLLATTGHFLGRNPAARGNAAEINQTIQLWDVASGQELRRVRDAGISAGAELAFSPDGKRLATVGPRSALVVWDPATGKEVRRAAVRHGLGYFLAYSPDGRVLAAGSVTGAVQTWDAASGKRLGSYDLPGAPRASLAFTRGGKLLAWASTGQALQVWDVVAEKALTPAGGHQAGVGAVGFVAGGRLVSVSVDGLICTWDEAGREVSRRQLAGDDRLSAGRAFGRASGAGLSPGGKYLLTADNISGLRLSELPEGRELMTITAGQLGRGVAAAFSPDERLLAVGDMGAAVPRAPVLRLYDLASGQELRQLNGHTGEPRALAFAPDGKSLISAASAFPAGQTSELRAWAVPGGKVLWKAEGLPGDVRGMALSHDGRTLAVLEQAGVIMLHDAADGRELRRLDAPPGDGLPTVIAFSPDDRLLALPVHDRAGRMGRVDLYEVASGTIRHQFVGHAGPVAALAFAPDGRRLASGSNDTTVLLWDLTGGAGSGPAERPKAAELGTLWEALNDLDGRAAWKAMCRLRQSPAEAVALLGRHVKTAAKGVDAATVARLIAALDADSFEEREQASKELERVGRAAEVPLREALAKSPSAEAKRRAEDLLEKLKAKVPSADQLRPLRAVEVLEGIGTPEAKKLLEALAAGDAGSPLTAAARAALGRVAAPRRSPTCSA